MGSNQHQATRLLPYLTQIHHMESRTQAIEFVSITSASSQSVDVTGINIDDNETNSGIIASDGYDYYNVPEGIFYHRHNGLHWVHNMYWKLKTPLKSGTLKKENLCIPCFHSLDGKPRYFHEKVREE